MDKKLTYWTLEENDLFEKYLFDQMDNAEKADFENKLVSEPDLNAKFLEFKRMCRTIEEDGLREKMEKFHQPFENTPDTIPLHKKSTKILYRIAASIALLTALGGTWYFYSSNSNERLFNSHFTPDPGLPTVMGNEENYTFYEAMVDYKMGDYPKAIEKWERLLLQKKDNDTLNYFLGAAHLANGEASYSIPYFEHVIKSERPPFYTEATFYKALAHLKNGEREAAIQSLGQQRDERSRMLLKALKDE